MPETYVALGSNLDDPVCQLDRAVWALKRLMRTRWINTSAYYQSKPMGPVDQPDYINAVIRLDTRLSPLALLKRLQRIEMNQGRPHHHPHWGARTLDLDLLLYGRKQLRQRGLIVPHYGLADRDFVVIPLLDVAEENLNIPGVGKLSGLKKKYQLHQLKKIK